MDGTFLVKNLEIVFKLKVRKPPKEIYSKPTKSWQTMSCRIKWVDRSEGKGLIDLKNFDWHLVHNLMRKLIDALLDIFGYRPSSKKARATEPRTITCAVHSCPAWQISMSHFWHDNLHALSHVFTSFHRWFETIKILFPSLPNPTTGAGGEEVTEPKWCNLSFLEQQSSLSEETSTPSPRLSPDCNKNLAAKPQTSLCPRWKK